jgi:hypothetical protein
MEICSRKLKSFIIFLKLFRKFYKEKEYLILCGELIMKLVELKYDKNKHKENIIKYNGFHGEFFEPLKVIFRVKGELLGGGCLKVYGGVYGYDLFNPYSFFQEMLKGLAFLLDEGRHTRRSYYRKDVEQHGPIDQIKNPDLAYYAYDLGFMYNDYTLELDKEKDELIIHYYNDPLSYTDCEEYKGKDSGSIRVPLKEFTKEIVKLAEEYIDLLKSTNVEEIDHDIKFLENLLTDVKKYYKERYGEEL